MASMTRLVDRERAAAWLRALAALGLLAGAAAGCERTPTPTPDTHEARGAAVKKLPAGVHAVDYHVAPEGDVPTLVMREREVALENGQELLVYVGAPWCEPCQRFHHAAEEGKLDGKMPPVRLLEFDAERDRERLRAAGYKSRLIPLFVRPATDGRSSGKQIEGGIKGDGAVDDITPRLRALVEAPL